MENFVEIAAPLHALMSGESKAYVTKYWGKAEAKAFALLMSANHTKQFFVETDASFEEFGAVLSQ